MVAELRSAERTAAEGAGQGRAAFAFIFVTVLVDVLAFTLVLPVLPRVLDQLTGGDVQATAAWLGILGITFAATQFLLSSWLGCLSDRYGRRPVVMLSNLGSAANFLLMALADSLPLMVIGRFLSGATAASFGTAYAYIADVTPASRRAHAYSLLGAAFGSGFILGPAIGGQLGGIDPRLPFWVAGALALLNFAYGLLVLPESLAPERRAAALHWRQLNPLHFLRGWHADGVLAGLAGLGTLATFAQYAVPTLLVLYTGQRYGWTAQGVGLALSATGLCGIAVQVGLTGRLVRRLGGRAVLLIAFAGSAAGLLVFGLAPTGAWFLAGIPLAALGEMGHPALQALMSVRVADSEQGRLQGSLKTLGSLAGVFAPSVFTAAFSLTAGGAAPPLPGGAFLLAGMLMGLTWLGALVATRQPRGPG